MDLKNIMRNITPSLTVMTVGLIGAFFVYNTYFSDRVASGFASYEPAAGQEAAIDAATQAAEVIEEDVIVEKEEEKKDITDAIEAEIEAGIKSLN